MWDGERDGWMKYNSPDQLRGERILLKELSTRLRAWHHTGALLQINKSYRFYILLLKKNKLYQRGCKIAFWELRSPRWSWSPLPVTISRWDGRCMSAPPVGLWAPPVPFGNQWPPCTSWCLDSSPIHLWGRGGWGFAFLLESGGCWFSARPAGRAASTDGCRNASPWSARTPRSEVWKRQTHY